MTTATAYTMRADGTLAYTLHSVRVALGADPFAGTPETWAQAARDLVATDPRGAAVRYLAAALSSARLSRTLAYEREAERLAAMPAPGDVRVATIDALVAMHTGFSSLVDMLNAAGNYRPSCDVSRREMARIADAYDAAQARRRDPRRAYRYGTPAPLEAGDAGRVWANQALRPAYVVAVAGDRALIQYGMPAGRAFLWDVPAATTWHEMSGDSGTWNMYDIVRNVSPKNPPARWRAVLASLAVKS
jgi:hypothetical protein